MEENQQTERAVKPLPKRIGRALLWFFAAMLVLTFVSRAASDALKARVSIGYLSSSSLDQSLTGSGSWVSGNTQFYTTYYTRRISKVYVQPGQQVKEGDPLFAYDVATVSGGKTASDRKVTASEKALEQAQKNLETAEDKAYAGRVVESAAQALDYARFTFAQTSALQNGGVVLATFSGTILSSDLSPGKASVSGSSGLEVALGDALFQFTVTAKEAERISIGDSVSLFSSEGKQEKKPLEVVSISVPDADGKVSVRCGGGDGRAIGSAQDWKLKNQSGQYETCVPLEALRQGGSNEYYVLVLVEKQTILGTQLAAKRVDVDLIAHDGSHAAVEGELTREDKLITVCSKEIKDGDLVVKNDAN
ncbi:MAG: hypothetical protein ABFC73_13730 [Clostridiaceae bacterium]